MFRGPLFRRRAKAYRDMNLDLRALARERLIFKARSCVFRSVEGIVKIKKGTRVLGLHDMAYKAQRDTIVTLGNENQLGMASFTND